MFIGVSLNVLENKSPTAVAIKVFPITCSMDFIPKAQFLNMVQHNGAFGCKDCLTKGDHVTSKKGFAHYYSYKETVQAELRCDRSFIEDAILSYSKNKRVCSFCLF